MNKVSLVSLSLLLSAAAVSAQTVLDISGDNTDTSYKNHSDAITIASGTSLDVKMARYCTLTSAISGSGTLNLYGGGERCFLGDKDGKTFPDWSNFKGQIHIYPFKENTTKAGFYGVILSHGGKSMSPDDVENAIRDGKLNATMASRRVTLHAGATLSNSGSSNLSSGYRIGELNAEEGSFIQGYMKTDKRGSYYLVGALGTDATLAGTIAPPSYTDTHPVGIIKEGRGTYRITGNNNYLTGSLRILKGKVLVCNDRAEAEQKKLRGALGAKTSENDAIAYIFDIATLGGTGSIGGTVDNYGTIEPGDNGIGVLTIQNYHTPSRNANLQLHPASILSFEVSTDEQYDQLKVGGVLKYSNMCQDFTTSEKMPVVQVSLDASTVASLKVGDEFSLITAKSKSGDWHFDLKQPGKFTWELVERQSSDNYVLALRLVSLDDATNEPENPGETDPDTPQMGAFYNDGIDDQQDQHTLRYYAEKCGKNVGVALCTYKGYDSEREEGGRQFNMMVAENEMKMDALQPNRGEFTYWGADNLVSLAQNHQMAVRGHCLVWHMQQPTWVSSDNGKKNDHNWTRSEALAIMKDHINNVLTHFKGKITEWDVVNECLDDDQSIVRSNPEGYTLRQNVWQRAIGNDYIDSAFVYAHRADPSLTLYLNDYDVELQGKTKSVAFYNLAMHLKNANIPLDGVGLQCHFTIGAVDSVKLESTVRRFGEAGLKCIITELDMGISSTTAKNLEEQARNYRVITDIMLNNDNCPSMLIWGMKDNDSWRSASNPLLYTAGMERKPAWYAVRSALRHRVLQQQTAVPAIQAVNKSDDHRIYDLCGRLVTEQSLRSGLYIRGGRKLLVH